MNLKIAIATAAAILILLLSLCVFLIVSSEKTAEEKLSDWVESGQARVIPEGGEEEIPVESIDIHNSTYATIRGPKGNPIATLPIDNLLNLTDQNNTIVIPVVYLSPIFLPNQSIPGSPPPSPTPVPIPIPTPPAVNNTVPTPTPTPTPVPSSPVCGNNKLETGEQCDDGNQISQDGCSSACKNEFCGDNIIQTMMLEQCEPPNTASCDANCKTIISPPSYPAYCTDNTWSGDESDQDCGGSCAPCLNVPPYNYCWVNSDCITNNCDTSAANPFPAIDPNPPNNVYATVSQIRILTGPQYLWVINWQGQCK